MDSVGRSQTPQFWWKSKQVPFSLLGVARPVSAGIKLVLIFSFKGHRRLLMFSVFLHKKVSVFLNPCVNLVKAVCG